MSFRLEVLLVLALVFLGVCERDPFKTLVAYEAKQRISAGVDENNYHLFPFRISSEPQHFVHIAETN